MAINQRQVGGIMMPIAFRYFWRSLQRGQFRWLWLAILLASLSVTFIEQLAHTVKASMLANSAELLGADLVIKSTRPIQLNEVLNKFSSNLEQAERVSLTTMVMSQDRFQLVTLQAVSANMPLLGTAYALSDWQASSEQVLIDPVLATQWSLKVDDEITLGNRVFRIQGILSEADPLQTVASQFAPRVIIPLASLAELGLTGAGSRINYERLFEGNDRQTQAFNQQLTRDKPEHWQVISSQSASDDLGKTLNTAWLFLDISALVSLLVAGLAVLIASRFYLTQWRKQLALMRALGMTQGQLTKLFALQFSLLALFASLLGVMLGQVGFFLISDYLVSLFPQFTMVSPWQASLMGLFSASLVFWAFSWPIFLKLVHTHPQQLFRSVSTPQAVWASVLGSSSALLLLLILLLPWHLVLWTFLALLIASGLLWVMASSVLWLLSKIQRVSQGWFAIALANVKRDPLLFRLQLIAFGLVLYLLLLMTLVQQQLLSHWQDSLPTQSPNVFVVNVQPEQREQLLSQLQSIQPKAELIAMVRSRITHLNNAPILSDSPRAKRLLDREANVAVLARLPVYNRLLASIELPSNSEHSGVSVEVGIAELLNIQLGDKITFDMVGLPAAYVVTSLREVKWQSLQANFFFIIEPNSRVELPVTYMASFFTDLSLAEQSQLKQRWQNEFPGVIWIDVQQLINQVRNLMTQASQAVGLLTLFTLVASLLVLLASTKASQDARLQQWLVLRTLGANQWQIRLIGLGEYALLGLLTGFFATSLASISSILISIYWLKIPATMSVSLWLVGLVVSSGSLLVMAWLTQSSYLRMHPRQLAQAMGE
jgi:putative ABC transport system permease protein